MKQLCILFFIIVCSVKSHTQTPSIQRIDPTNWWVGMKNKNLQLLIYGTGAGKLSYTINYPGVQLVKTTKVANPNYAFLDLVIAPTAKPGSMQVIGKGGNKTITKSYRLLARTSTAKGTGVSAKDFIYLVLPDRFSNGDTSNDKFANMADATVDLTNSSLRHGGDLRGITNHLDYLKELGVTAIWPTPVIINDEQLKLEGPNRLQAGFHGYHFTDHYQVDPRFGGNEGYAAFSKTLHQNGFKLVQDAVYNHVSDEHWMFKDQPTKDWFNQWPEYTSSSHKEQTLPDPHGAAIDRKLLLDGWFTSFLPDVNARNPLFATYLIQNAIWYTEKFDVDAWRIDTYKYNDPAFMNRCNQALIDEYPHIHLFGESTTGNPLTLSYFVKSNVQYTLKSNLPGSLDFPVTYAMLDALNSDFSWDGGVNKLYQIIAQDAVYADPMKMVTQLDNHDMDRFLSVIGSDFDKYKMGITWLLTTRGIPSWYYGTEILMKNTKNPSDAEVRKDFPGGFPGDKENKFVAAGRSKQENEAFDFVKRLANYRKNTPTLYAGKLMQYVPADGAYVYFRYDDANSIMIATNTTGKEMKLKTSRFSERMNGFNSAKNVLTNETLNNLSEITLPAKTALVLELAK